MPNVLVGSPAWVSAVADMIIGEVEKSRAREVVAAVNATIDDTGASEDESVTHQECCKRG